jgi:hypothetical protein
MLVNTSSNWIVAAEKFDLSAAQVIELCIEFDS